MKVNEAYEKWKLSIHLGASECTEAREKLGEALFDYIKAIIASRYGRSYSFMEDAVGETFCKVLENLPYFGQNKEEGKGNLAKWVYVITRNTCADMARSRYRRNEISIQEGLHKPVQTSYIEKLTVDRLIDKLPEEDRTLIRMKVEEYSNEDIAARLGISVSAVKKRYVRRMGKLRTLGGGT
jgi:RNA polymerase sigma factor (sigma-70 family)